MKNKTASKLIKKAKEPEVKLLSKGELELIKKALGRYRKSKINIVDTFAEDISENKKLEIYYKIAEISMIIDRIG